MKFLNDFWKPFHKNVEDIMKTDFETIFKPLNEIFSNYFLGAEENRKCPKCGSELSLKSSRTGCFFGCNNYPNCKYAISLEGNEDKNNTENDNQTINHPVYGEITIKKGPYGKYCEYNKDGKIKRSSLPNEEITPEILDFYLSLPLTLGKNKDGEDIITNVGKFGPYVLCDKKFYSYKEKPYHNITLDKALSVILQPKTFKRTTKKKK